ncbi:hypothetical protein SAMD00019534_104410 [Acytostelium subglobosum LB1]|uniref:hypothetical protein n=1 Tax=Acytostelium subglobosum LB1 TaxID=1410327 RepID=UPI000644FDE3|nr:hypothetical protein SAMD00019534_104410 [Acytostelium subglobosum LB1]GAM27266.1 hypothetical protein SAMD00019534_104410 [Acytostelium subglobosum LB1]|eukprot:XP_012749733.1 hypothetical protein SAMD00019534_104410 [Acytostelium subglobosum LB1]
MKILIAFDKFKDCIGSKEVGDLLAKSIESSWLEQTCSLDIDVISISDGGEGFLKSLTLPLDLTIQRCIVTGPLGNKIESMYGYNKDSGIGVVEMALASGIELVPSESRNPLNTTTKGTGELISHAINTNGLKRIIIGAGGSATNDGGLGALNALGVKVTLNNGEQPDTIYGRHLEQLESVVIDNDLLERLKGVTFEFSTDVVSPFVGPKGAVNIFAKQKGASSEERVRLERGMINLNKLFPVDISQVEGTGAAGGLAGGFVSIFNARIRKGIDYVCQLINVEDKIKQADIIITGEGCFDRSSLEGKAVSKFLDYGRQNQKKVIIICGVRKDNDNDEHDADIKLEKDIDIGHGATAIFDLVSRYGRDESMHNIGQCLDRLVASDLIKCIVEAPL